MSEQLVLEVAERTLIGKQIKQRRAQGLIPGVVYGRGIESVAVEIDQKTMQRMLVTAGGTSIIELDINGKRVPTVVRDVQRDKIRGNLLHVDFFAVDMARKIVTEVPISLINEAPALESGEALLVTGTNYLTLECLPADMIAEFEVDMSVLTEIGTSINVSDLISPPNIEIMNSPDDLIAQITYRPEEEEEEEEEEFVEIDADMVEVIARGKEEEDDEAEEI